MAKKRGKFKHTTSSKKKVRKAKSRKKILEKSAEIQKPIKKALREFGVFAEERKIERKMEDVEEEQKKIEKKEGIIAEEEGKIEKETEEIEKLEKEIKEEVTQKPLTKFNMKDLNKGIIGAFIGVVAHFAFVYGKEIAKDITAARATVLIIFSYLLIIILMYETGYREIKEKRVLGVVPIRATVIFMTSIVVILVIFFLFNQVDLSDLVGLYKQIAVTSVLAALGAGTADLIGRD